MVASSKRRTTRRALIAAVSVVMFVAELPTPAIAADKPSTAAPKADPYGDFIAEAAQRFDIPEIWIRAVIQVESDGNSRALSLTGAIGLMQIMPATWGEIRARHLLGTDPFEPHDNIIAGAAYIRQLYDRYGSPGFLAAYNAGPKRYDEHVSKSIPLPPETRTYVAMVSALIGKAPTAASQDDGSRTASPWAAAPLFAGQMRASIESDPSPTKDTHMAVPDERPANVQSAVKPPVESLFVTRPPAGTAQ